MRRGRGEISGLRNIPRSESRRAPVAWRSPLWNRKYATFRRDENLTGTSGVDRANFTARCAHLSASMKGGRLNDRALTIVHVTWHPISADGKTSSAGTSPSRVENQRSSDFR